MKGTTITKPNVTGVILAGGQARRMDGEDKGLITLNGRPMIQHVLEAIRPQVDYILINANRNLDIYAQYECPVIKDEFDGYCGPLAGMASCLRVVNTPIMVTAPCDSPFVPENLVDRLYRQLLKEDAGISVAHDGVRLQPVFSMMRTDLLGSMLEFLQEGERKIDKWFARHKLAIADFSDRPDTFININTRVDLTMIESKLNREEKPDA
jgi:molybdopterin-guanine dinucleotide biosynthesis protein A, proteobacterial